MSSSSSTSLPPIPPPQAFINAITARLSSTSSALKSSSPIMTNATVLEKGGNRGSCYIDCESVEAAASIAKLCSTTEESNSSLITFTESDATAIDEYWKLKVSSGGLIVTQKFENKKEECVDEKTGKKFFKVVDRTPTATIFVTYPKNNNTGAVTKPVAEERKSEEKKNHEESSMKDTKVAEEDKAPNANNNNNNNNNNQTNKNNDDDDHQQQKQQQAPPPTFTFSPPLYVRCKKLYKIGQVFDFFRLHNIQGHADDCVYCQSSKKPYFIVEWGKNVTAFQSSLFLDGLRFEGEEVKVMKSQQTAKNYREKKPEAQSLAVNREKKIRQREEAVAEATDLVGGGLVPISVLINSKPTQQQHETVDEGGPKKPPAPE